MGTTARLHRIRAVLSVLVLAASVVVVPLVAAPSAAAAPAPIGEPGDAVVTADGLPTAQINGVVWQQAIVGNTVYAGGNFSAARPAGSAPGANQVTRSNLLSFNISTGALIGSFAPALNGQVRAVTTSPDGSRLYVGGEFTSIGGVSRSRIAAFDTATGALVTSFDARVDYTVRTIVATASTIYVGGAFTNSRNVSRTRLAAFSASTGALTGWNPTADATVNAMVLAPGGSKLIIGGAFQNVNGSPAYGLASLDATTGALLPWAAVNTVRDAGKNAAILALTTDGSSIYGVGYVFGSGGNLEGAFKADAGSGAIQWIEDCHGDTYDVAAIGSHVYTVSHAHWCGGVGGFLESNPRATNMRHALVFSKATTGTLARNNGGSSYKNWEGSPSPTLYNWFPDLDNGTFTGQAQAAWDVTGNADYVVLGGEFPRVNGTAQQGLVRFARRPLAPTSQGPRLSGAAFQPTSTGVAPGAVRISWPTNWDRDDLSLSYRVVRDGNTAAPVNTRSATGVFWQRPTLSYQDTVAPSSTHTYRIDAVDRDGNTVQSPTISVTAPAGQGNQPPTASFTASVSGRAVSVNSAASTDSDGTIASRSWNWGDGTAAGSGTSTSHTYAADGTYTVVLTVVDDAGASSSVSRTVTIGGGTPQAGAADSFGRTVTGGWGSAGTGGAWSLTGGNTRFSVDGAAGRIVMAAPGSGPTASLAGVSVRDLDGTIEIGFDKAATGSGVYSTLTTRKIGTSSYQFTTKFLAGGAVTVSITRVLNGTSTSLGTATVSGLTVGAGDAVRTRFRAVGAGTTTLGVKAWKVGAAEPAAFAVSRTDTSAALQAAGSFGLQTYLSGSATNSPLTARIDNFVLTPG